MSANVHIAMPHLVEVLKIVEGAVNADREKVTAYTEMLASKLAAEGHGKVAERLHRVLQNSKTRMLEVSRTAPATKLPVDNESRLSLADEQRYERGEAVVFMSPEVMAAAPSQNEGRGAGRPRWKGGGGWRAYIPAR